MAAKKFIGYTTTALTVYGIIERQTDSYLLNDADGSFAAAPADPYVSFTEHSVIKGEYVLSESRTVWTDGMYKCTVYEQAGGSPVPASDNVVNYQYMYCVSDAEAVTETNINTLLTRLTSTRATYLDYLFSIYFGLVSAVSQAQTGAAGSVTLNASASAVNDFYKGQVIVIYTGTGAGQARACYGYDGTTKVALIRPNWAVTPDNTSWYVITTWGSVVTAALEDIDFSTTMKTSLNAATPALSAAGVDAILDEVVEGSTTFRQMLKIFMAALAGKSTGGGTATLTFRDIADTKARITATVTTAGNRTAITLDGT